MPATNGLSDSIVVLLSGGMDSAVCLALALDETTKVFPLIFDYGQVHSKEIDSAIDLCEHYHLTPQIIKIILPSISPLLKQSKMKIDPKVNYVPFRNTIFLSIASGYAESIKANKIYYGANDLDSPDYPDCRPIYIEAMNDVLAIHDSDIRIEGPLMSMKKGQILSLGFGRCVPFEKTWSCHRGLEKSCGKCPGCTNRLRGFNEVGKADPLEYDLLA